MKAKDEVLLDGLAEGQVEVTITFGPNVTIARAEVPGHFVAVADAKRAPGDPFDEEVAGNLAAGRALRALGDQLVASALSRSDELVSV